jgi:tRNA nucleotidyltransferase (CCA-adding enzyme)
MALTSTDSIRQLMTTPPVTAAPDWTVGKVIDLMLDRDVSTLLIVDAQGRMVGLVSESSLLAPAFDPQLRAHPISLHMQRQFASVDVRETIEGLLETFLLHRVRHLPVMEDGRPVGVISRRDVLRSLMAR